MGTCDDSFRRIDTTGRRQQLLAEAPSAPDYTARLACSLAGDLADILVELEQSVDAGARGARNNV